MDTRFARGAALAACLLALCIIPMARAQTSTPTAMGAPAMEPAVADPLTATIRALDTRVFDAFNRCADPDQLEAHAGHFAEDVEFYHDNGGVTWTREAMLANTRQHACGNYTRVLVPDSLQVHPVRDFGAIATGMHRFCQTGGDTCDGLADFVMVWRLSEGRWRVTRVLSYGHGAADAAP